MTERDNRRPILYNGQIYSEPVDKSGGFGDKEWRYTYEESRDSVIQHLQKTKLSLNALPRSSRLPNEVIVSMTLHPEFTAKSYYPDALFDDVVARFGLVEIGSRVWSAKTEEKAVAEVSSKLIFVRATEDSLESFERQLNKSTNALTKVFKNDIRKISSIGLFPYDNQIQGFEEDWKSGRIEAVLHPFAIDKGLAKKHFFDILREASVDMKTARFKQYESGVSFASFIGDRKVLEMIRGYNPLRTAHPLRMRDLPTNTRGAEVINGPGIPEYKNKPSLVVGIIDGGIQEANPYISNYTEDSFLASGKPVPAFQEHGTQVAGSLLFGSLNGYSSKDVIPEPRVSVRSFGVLSEDTTDPNLYDVIDLIEEIIPSNPDISVYNLSIGPWGPIQDDNISRFTYACDSLSYKYNVLLCIAVGNDGDKPDYDRIQSPADSVNGLSIGAYSIREGFNVKAPYSCVGPGREGCKMKPDVLAFGGCDQHPIHLVASAAGKKTWSAGTSFASPIVAGMAGRLMVDSRHVIDPLIAKAVLIHSAKNNSEEYNIEMGHGIIPDQVSEILTCQDSSYTLIYSSEIEYGKYAEFLIPWDGSIREGTASFKWTAAVLTDVDQLSSDDYTFSAIEVSFYPNRNKYLFKNVNKIALDGSYKLSEIVDIDRDPDRELILLENGWEKGSFPVTSSAVSQFRTERDLRKDLKWDSVDTREISKRVVGISQPAFHIHALGRGKRNESKSVKFALILTVSTPKSKVDIYSKILNTYSALIPLNIISESEVVVRVDSEE